MYLNMGIYLFLIYVDSHYLLLYYIFLLDYELNFLLF